MDDFIYNGIIDNIARKFENELCNIEAKYNFDYGDEFEIAVCKFLRRFLPLKYGVCRGFVVDKNGNSAGDDVIIYDQELFPTLRFLDVENQFTQKEQIPVEAVYAYIEAKYTLNENTLKKAIKQVYNVKKLCYSRNCKSKVPVIDGLHIFNNKYSEANGWNPCIYNPVYGMILSANCVDVNGNKTMLGSETTHFLFKAIREDLKLDIDEMKYYCFDSVIAGKSTTAFCGHYLYDKNGNIIDGVLLTRFYTGINSCSCYQINTHENIAFGLAIAHLMMALNFIQLDTMPWDMIFNTAKMPNREEREQFLKVLENME